LQLPFLRTSAPSPRFSTASVLDSATDLRVLVETVCQTSLPPARLTLSLGNGPNAPTESLTFSVGSIYIAMRTETKNEALIATIGTALGDYAHSVSVLR
ncbi:hypothetical protein CI238_08236, partial [Colletotrichum incanum]